MDFVGKAEEEKRANSVVEDTVVEEVKEAQEVEEVQEETVTEETVVEEQQVEVKPIEVNTLEDKINQSEKSLEDLLNKLEKDNPLYEVVSIMKEQNEAIKKEQARARLGNLELIAKRHIDKLGVNDNVLEFINISDKDTEETVKNRISKLVTLAKSINNKGTKVEVGTDKPVSKTGLKVVQSTSQKTEKEVMKTEFGANLFKQLNANRKKKL